MGLTPYFERGGTTLYLGDCKKILPQIGTLPNLILTSPPYDNLRAYGGYDFDFQEISAAIVNTMPSGAVLVWVVGDGSDESGESGNSFRHALRFKELGLRLHDTMIYEKNGASYPCQDRYYQTFEYMFVLSRGRPAVTNLLKDRRNIWDGSWGKRSRRDVHGELILGDKTSSDDYGVRWNIWRYNVGEFGEEAGHGEGHPAVFPHALARDHILSWTDEGDLVLDPMCGSGTVLQAAKKLKRRAIGIDVNEDYLKIAVERLRQDVLF